MTTDRQVQGICPACKSRGSLFLADGGYITCSWSQCSNPGAADDLLGSLLIEGLVTTKGDNTMLGHGVQGPWAWVTIYGDYEMGMRFLLVEKGADDDR